jgi:hypothetical protein
VRLTLVPKWLHRKLCAKRGALLNPPGKSVTAVSSGGVPFEVEFLGAAEGDVGKMADLLTRDES